MEAISPEKRPPSLYSQTPKIGMTSGKKNDIGDTPGPMNRNFDRNLVRTSLDNPSFMEGRPPSGSLNRDINGAKSTKIFARQAEDVISGRSVMEPAIM